MTWCRLMALDRLIRPSLIRIKTDISDNCFFCGKQSFKKVFSENDVDLFLCKAHFEALTKKLHNFKY